MQTFSFGQDLVFDAFIQFKVIVYPPQNVHHDADFKRTQWHWKYVNFRSTLGSSSAWMPWRGWSCATRTGTVKRPGQAILGWVGIICMRLVVIYKYTVLYKQVPCPCTKVNIKTLLSPIHRQVDFDKTKHLAESSSKQRKAERERIINEERFDTRLKNKRRETLCKKYSHFSYQGKREVREKAGGAGGDAEKSANVSLSTCPFTQIFW